MSTIAYDRGAYFHQYKKRYRSNCRQHYSLIVINTMVRASGDQWRSRDMMFLKGGQTMVVASPA